ncbi:trichohyalin-like isoform X1 [Hemibagrus wyckioides]|uniref:trichohyalin-like isoform X1 n=1 Tax=Hemibagrus wyckioides TaxID=337641 RepID=UPI00266DA75E|nr:trichohyalin-like isoform X1 [Hemibagrus wyckioides]
MLRWNTAVCSKSVNMAGRKKRFLKDHRKEFIQKTREPTQLADEILDKKCIGKETYDTILSKRTKQKQTREIFNCLNSQAHFECAYDWLKENEAALLEELENRDSEAAAPQEKRARLKNVDETDNITEVPDLKQISTFAKLEDWVSDPNISQNLLHDFEEKLTNESMAELKKELKDKEPKKSLCFNADNIDEIRKNKELDTFLYTTKDAKFPKLALKMFFKKCGAASSGNEAQSSTDHEETMDTITDLGSSGYGSLSSSLNNSYSSHNIDCLRQNNKSLPDEDPLIVCSPTGDKAIKIHENKDKEIESKTTEQHHGGSFILLHHEAKSDASSQEPMESQDIHIDEMEEQSQTSDSVKRHEDVCLQKSEQFTKKERPQEDGLGRMEMQETHIRETDDEPQRSYEPNDPKYDDVFLHQNEQFTKKETQLEDGRTDMEDTHIRKTDEEPQRSYGPNDTWREDASVRRNESARSGNMIMQQNEQENMQLGSENKDKEIESKTTEQHHGGSFILLHHEAKSDASSQEPMESQDIHIDEMEEQSQTSDSVKRHEDVCLQKSEQFAKKVRPQEDGLGRMEMQETHIRETDDEPQRSYEPNDPRYERQKNEQFTKKETQLEYGRTDMEDTHIRTTDEEPQRSYGPNDTRHKYASVRRHESATCGEMIMQQNENMQLDPENKDNEIESKTTEQHHGGSFIQLHYEAKSDASSQEPMESQDIHNDEMEEQSQTSDSVKRHEDVCLQKSEQFTKKERPQEDGLGRMEMQETHIRETDDEPQRSYEPNDPKYDDVFLHQNEQFTKKETQLEDGRTDMEDTHIRKTDEEPQRSYGPNDTRHKYASVRRHESATCGEMIMQQNVQENMQLDPEPFYQKQQQESNAGSVAESTQSNGTEILAQNANTAIIASKGSLKFQLKATKKRETSKYQKEKKKEEKDRLLKWAKRQCNGSKEELEQIFDQISIKNLVEHADYPCFTAENVMVYKNLTAESQIIFITNDNNSISTMTKVNYQMFVCNISKAIILGPKEPTEKMIEYAEDKVNIDKCTNFVFKVFAPVLAEFKKIQKQEKLYSLIVQ